MRTKGEGAAAAKKAVDNYRSQQKVFAKELEETAKNRRHCEDALQKAFLEAAAKMLPQASPESLAFIAKVLEEPTLLEQRDIHIAAQPRREARRNEIQSDADFLARASLLGPKGKLEKLKTTHQRDQQQAEQSLQRFDIESFQWLQNRAEGQTTQGAFGKFWQAVTFGEYRENRAKKRAVEELNFSSWEELQENHRKWLTAEKHAQLELDKATARAESIVALQAEIVDLNAWSERFEERLCVEIQREIAGMLALRDLKALHKALRDHPARASLAVAHGLQQKIDYFKNIETYLVGEVEDRKKRILSIDKTRRLWEAKPWDRLDGDKSKWLVAVPEMKRASAQKRHRWVRRMRLNIYDHDQWDTYDHYMYECEGFLAYDAFGHCADESMPWDGFAVTVIDDIGPFREEQGQEKQDYSVFKNVDQYEWERPEDAAANAQAESEMAAAAALTLAAEVAMVDAS